MPEFPDDIDKNVPEIQLYIFNKYPEIFVTTNVRRPHINKNLFQEAIGVLNSEINNRFLCIGKRGLINIINEKNERMRLWPVESYQKE